MMKVLQVGEKRHVLAPFGHIQALRCLIDLIASNPKVKGLGTLCMAMLNCV
jgi:hypothetical protein